MLNLILSNRASTVVIIPIVLLVFWIGSFFQVIPESTNPTFVYSLIYDGLAAYPVYSRIFGFVAVVFLVFFTNRIFNANDFYSKENAVPAIALVIMLGAWSGFHFFSPIFISMAFLLMAIHRILRIYHQKSILRELFDASFLIGMASLFYYPLALFALSIYGFLFISRSFNFREAILPLIGLSTAFYFLGVVFFYFNIPYDFFGSSHNEVIKSLLFESGLTQRFYLVVTVILLSISLIYIFRLLGKAKVQVQLSRKFLLIFFINGVLVYWVSFIFYPIVESALFLVFPMALIIPFFFYESKPVVRELGFYFWLVAALLFDYVSL